MAEEEGWGLLVVKDKEGTTRGRGGPSLAALLGPAGPLVAGDHLQHDSPPVSEYYLQK